MTERDIQLAIFWHRAFIRAYPVVVPNIYFGEWEADCLYVTSGRYLYEFEIKVTYSDFKADFKKEKKHQRLVNNPPLANFSYVCPDGVIPKEEVPEYAGLYYVREWNPDYAHMKYKLVEIVKPPRLKTTNQISDDKYMRILEKGLSRYWHYRTNNEFSLCEGVKE